MENINNYLLFIKDVVIEGYLRNEPYTYYTYGHLLKTELTDDGLFFDFDYLWIYQTGEVKTNVRLKLSDKYKLFADGSYKCISENFIINDFAKIIKEKCNIILDKRHLKARRKTIERYYQIIDLKQKLPGILKYSGLLYDFSDEDLEKISDFAIKLIKNKDRNN